MISACRYNDTRELLQKLVRKCYQKMKSIFFEKQKGDGGLGGAAVSKEWRIE